MTTGKLIIISRESSSSTDGIASDISIFEKISTGDFKK
jgi:hypothetical protein